MLFGSKLFSQYFEDDARLWLNIEAKKKLTDKLSANFTLQNRLENNVSEYTKLYFNAGLSYKINEYIKPFAEVVAGMRRNLDGSYAPRYRYSLGLTLKKEIKTFTLQYRNVFQGRFTSFNYEVADDLPRYFNKNRVTIKNEITNRLEVYLAQEVYLELNNFKENNINRSRTTIGTSYKLTKKSSIEAYFLFQRRFTNKNEPKRDFIYGITYSIDF